jgi:hypothetical protein
MGAFVHALLESRAKRRTTHPQARIYAPYRAVGRAAISREACI